MKPLEQLQRLGVLALRIECLHERGDLIGEVAVLVAREGLTWRQLSHIGEEVDRELTDESPGDGSAARNGG